MTIQILSKVHFIKSSFYQKFWGNLLFSFQSSTLMGSFLTNQKVIFPILFLIHLISYFKSMLPNWSNFYTILESKLLNQVTVNSYRHLGNLVFHQKVFIENSLLWENMAAYILFTCINKWTHKNCFYRSFFSAW